ncbi:hypothetical protein COP2_007472 [Malus domestica]
MEGTAASPSGMVRPSQAVLRHTRGTSILASVFAMGICDLVTFARSVKAYACFERCSEDLEYVAFQFQTRQCEDLNET